MNHPLSCKTPHFLPEVPRRTGLSCLKLPFISFLLFSSPQLLLRVLPGITFQTHYLFSNSDPGLLLLLGDLCLRQGVTLTPASAFAAKRWIRGPGSERIRRPEVLGSRFYLYIFGDRGRKRERKGEKHPCERETSVTCQLPFRCTPTRNQTHNPGMCPDRESNLQPFTFQDDAQPTESCQSGLKPQVQVLAP